MSKTIKGMELNLVWVVSTGHIARTDDMLLRADSLGGGTLIAHSKDGGYFVFVPEEEEIPQLVRRLRKAGYSKEFCEIMELASKNKVGWVQFDADGPAYSELPTFDW